jgi:hypothetical protein
VTVAVTELSAVARGGGIFDQLQLAGPDVSGPAWREASRCPHLLGELSRLARFFFDSQPFGPGGAIRQLGPRGFGTAATLAH